LGGVRVNPKMNTTPIIRMRNGAILLISCGFKLLKFKMSEYLKNIVKLTISKI